MAHHIFNDRAEAGTKLGHEVARLDISRPVVLGLPRGGVPVAARVAEAITAPLDVIVVRKLGVPSQPELAMGAIGEDDIVVINDDVVTSVRIDKTELDAATNRERATLESSLESIRAVRPRHELRDHTAVIVDDGIATGATMRAAIAVARANDVRGVVVATPLAPREVVEELGAEADQVVCLVQPDLFGSVGRWYRHFAPVSDQEVRDLLLTSMKWMPD